jgi:saccharopine dehydrogenase-like NADP-dependent oxidoreductase
VGCGTVGSRAARQMLTVKGVTDLVLFDLDSSIAVRLAQSLGSTDTTSVRTVAGSPIEHAGLFDVVLLATPAGQAPMAERFAERGVSVVTTTDAVPDVRQLLTLQQTAEEHSATIVVAAGFAPGLTDVLAAHAARQFQTVREVHTAKLGTAGPACARQHHAALSHESNDFRDGEWLQRPGGSGRELVWFPDPIGGADCYRASLPDALLLHRLFPNADRLSGRMAATRRDRLTSRLRMLRKPHAEAGPGAIKVEVRGQLNGEETSVVLACMDRPSVAAGAVAALSAGAVLTGFARRADLANQFGCFSVGEYVNSIVFLRELAVRGVKCAKFEGTGER